MICVGVASGGWLKSAWSPSYGKIVLEIAKFWTTPIDGILLVYYKGINRGSTGDQQGAELMIAQAHRHVRAECADDC